MKVAVFLKPLHLCGFIVLFFGCSIASLAQTTLTFSYTGTPQTFTVPPCVYSIHVKAWGAGGSGGGADSYGGAVGGAGASIESDIPVVPGQILTIIVGGGAGPGGSGGGCCAGIAGWGNGVFDGGNGGVTGGSGGSGGGGGGGGGTGLSNGLTPLLVAAGGGGGSGGGQYSSGATGGGGGQDGNASPGSCNSPGLTGASPSGNGSVGANKGGGDGGGGGGGGGGYNGGTGGGVATGCDCGACGGGGGSSWASGTIANTIITNGNGQTPGNSTDPDLPAGVAIGGGTSTSGGNGFLALVFNGAPNVNFGKTTVCSGNVNLFTDSTLNSSGTITSWTWDFGDGSPVNSTQSPSYTYGSGGTYNVTLIVNNSFSCADTLTKVVQVYYTPVAGFTNSNTCFGDSMYFTNTSVVDVSTSIASYSWDFGDGSASGNLQNPGHNYALSSTFNVTLVATTVDGCSNAISIPVNVYDAPVSSFTFGSVCAGLDSAHFINTTTNPTMGTVANWYWDFGDATPPNTTIWSPSHLYSSAGNYQVTLITYSSNGCSDTALNTITVFPVPQADFSFADVCLHQAINFHDSTTLSGGTIASWSWDFGDGSPPDIAQNPSHTYANAGTYSVVLTATSNNGCQDSITKNIVVHPLPHPEFSSLNVCEGNTMQFNNLSTIPNTDAIQSYSWNFGDGSSFNTNLSPSHLYAGVGAYTIWLFDVSTFGCKDSISKIRVVNPKPVVSFTASDTIRCEPVCADLQNLSIIATGNNAAFLWNFGDGSGGSTSQNPHHCFNNDSVFAPIAYSVSLTVTSDSGCVTTLAKNNYITVFPMPVAVCTASEYTIVEGNTTQLHATGGGSYHWLPSTGLSCDTCQSPIASPMQNITYCVRVSGLHACADSACVTINVEKFCPELTVPNAFSPNNDGHNDKYCLHGWSGCIKKFNIIIFDRWGAKVFESDDPEFCWDGASAAFVSTQGSKPTENPMNSNVFVYFIKATDNNGKQLTKKGNITLIQ